MRKWRKSHVSNVTTQGEGVGVEQKDHKRLQIAIILKQTKGGGGGGINFYFKETRFAPQNKKSKMPEKTKNKKTVKSETNRGRDIGGNSYATSQGKKKKKTCM